MAEKIEVADSRLLAREQKAIADLREEYPDQVVRSLDTQHKALGKRLTKISKEIGYASRQEMLNAYGFSVEKSRNRYTVDFDTLFAELESRYEGKPAPAKMGDLIAENPDLKGQLKTLQNSSKERFGTTAAKLLKERGILGTRSAAQADKPPAPSPDPAEQARRAKEPEDARARRAEETEERAAARLQDAYRLLEELGEKLCDVVPASSKPAEISELVEMFPEWADRIESARKLRVIGKRKLQQLGILYARSYPPVGSVGSAKLLELLPDSMRRIAISPDDGDTGMPPWIAGVDFASGTELRRTTIGAWHDGSSAEKPGDVFDVRAVEADSAEQSPYGAPVLDFEVATETPSLSTPRFSGWLFSGIADGSSSELQGHATRAKVVSASEHGGRTFLVLEMTYPGELGTDGIVALLRERGVVTDADLAGGMGWRFRLWKLRREEGME